MEHDMHNNYILDLLIRKQKNVIGRIWTFIYLTKFGVIVDSERKYESELACGPVECTIKTSGHPRTYYDW